MALEPGPDQPNGVGCVFVPAFILLCAVLIWSLGCQPAQALEPCVRYADICVPGYVVKYLPPEPPSVPVAAVSVAVVTRESHARTIAEHFWPSWAVPRMMRIAVCESDLNPQAVNPRSGAAGIWQIMPQWKRVWPGDYLDGWTNGAVAYQIWLVQGFDAWVCK